MGGIAGWLPSLENQLNVRFPSSCTFEDREGTTPFTAKRALSVRGGSNSVSVHPTLNGFTWTTSSRSSCDAWRSREVLVRYTTETGFIFSAPQKASPQPSGIIPAFIFPRQRWF